MLIKPFGKTIEILIQREVVKRVVIFKLMIFFLFDFFKVANKHTVPLMVNYMTT